MDNERARQLVEQGGAFLFLDVPHGSYFGLDHQVFIVGEKFKGVKMVPPGPHFIRYHATSTHGDVSPATSFFVHVALRSVLVRRWDALQEKLCTIADEDEVERFANGVRRFDFDQYLAPYDLSRYHEWQSLSSHITEEIIQKLSPASGEISSMSEDAIDEPHTPAEQQLQQQLDEGHKRQALAAKRTATVEEVSCGNDSSMEVDTSAGGGGEEEQAGGTRGGEASTSGSCHYSTVPRLVKPSGATAQQLTALNMDKSPILDGIMQERYGGRYEAILGELQFAFVTFVYGQSLAGFGQWKTLLGLLLESEAALIHRSPPLLAAFLRVLMAQLRVSITAPEGEGSQPPSLGVALVDELLPDSFLRRLFGNFFQTIHDNHGALSQEGFAEVEKLRRLLRERLGWDFEVEVLGGDSDDEYAPVMVEVPEGVVLG